MSPTLRPGAADGPELEWIRTMFADDKASEWMGIEITKVVPGQAWGQMVITENMCNGHLTVHGGMLFAFADSMFAAACNSSGNAAVGAQTQMHYIKPAFAGELIEAHAVERQTWGRNGITDVTLTRGGEVIAEFRGTSRIVSRRDV